MRYSISHLILLSINAVVRSIQSEPDGLSAEWKLFLRVVFILFFVVVAVRIQHKGMKTDYKFLPEPQMRLALFLPAFMAALIGSWSIPLEFFWFRILLSTAIGLSWAFTVQKQWERSQADIERRAKERSKRRND